MSLFLSYFGSRNFFKNLNMLLLKKVTHLGCIYGTQYIFLHVKCTVQFVDSKMCA